METIMNRNFIKLFLLLLAVSPSLLAMERPNSALFRAKEDVIITPSAEIINKIVEFRNRTITRERRLQLLSDIAPYMHIGRIELDKIQVEENGQLSCYEPQKYVHIFLWTELDDLTKEKVSSRINEERKTYARLLGLPEDRTPMQRLQVYWNTMPPVVKAGVALGSAMATSYGAKKLYDFVSKRN